MAAWLAFSIGLLLLGFLLRRHGLPSAKATGLRGRAHNNKWPRREAVRLRALEQVPGNREETSEEGGPCAPRHVSSFLMPLLYSSVRKDDAPH